MSDPVFSDAWAQACGERLNQNAAYRAAAATWEGSLLLLMTEAGPEGERRVFLDLWRGDCRVARAAAAEDEAAARYVLSGPLSAWHLVLTGKVPPLLAIMTGRIKLTKGALADLVPHVGAAKELVSTAASVPSIFPDGR